MYIINPDEDNLSLRYTQSLQESIDIIETIINYVKEQ